MSMVSRRILITTCLTAALIAVPGASASAGPEDNPQAGHLSSISCANGLVAETAAGVGRTGHTDIGVVGVATSVFVLTGPGGDIVATAFDVPGGGLDGVTTWCEWFQDDLWFGGDVILQGNAR